MLVTVAVVCIAVLGLADASSDRCYVPHRIQDCGTWVCNKTSDTCMPCVTHADCYFSAQSCHSGNCKTTPVYHRDWVKVLGAVLAGVGICTIGVLAGVGGGGAMTPAYAGILEMPLTLSVIASLASIFGQGLLNVPYLMPQSFPEGPRRPLINYPVLALWYPITAAGTLVGAHWRNAVPDWFRNLILIVVSVLVSIRVVYHAYKARQEERQEKMGLLHANASGFQSVAVSDDPHTPKDPTGYSSAARVHSGRLQSGAPSSGRSSKRHPSAVRASLYSVDAEGVALLRDDGDPSQYDGSDDESEDQALARFPVHYISSLIFIVGAVTVSKWGSRSSTCGGGMYWLSLGLGGVALLLVFVGWRLYLRFIRSRVQSGALPPHHDQIENTQRALLVFPLLSSIAGFCSSTVGIGGGTLINPLLLEAGLRPEEASATGGMFTFLIALQSTLSALMDGSSDALDALWLAYFALIGFISTVIGRLFLLPYFKRKGATSVIVAALALSLVLTFVAVAAYGTVSFLAMVKYHVPIRFAALCPKPHASHTATKH